jgi:DNA-nicking Smr family endonuclease
MSRRRKPAAAPRSAPATDDDVELFRSAIGPVRVLPGDDHAAVRLPPPEPVPSQFLRDEARVIGELLNYPSDPTAAEPGGELSYVRDGHDPRLLKRLRRGLFAVQDEIDLHQMKVAAARTVIREFLAHARSEGHRCVKLIPGKGLRSPDGPVLKVLVDGMLRQHGDVIAFASTPSNEGGTGAVLVLLQRRQR